MERRTTVATGKIIATYTVSVQLCSNLIYNKNAIASDVVLIINLDIILFVITDNQIEEVHSKTYNHSSLRKG